MVGICLSQAKCSSPLLPLSSSSRVLFRDVVGNDSLELGKFCIE